VKKIIFPLCILLLVLSTNADARIRARGGAAEEDILFIADVPLKIDGKSFYLGHMISSHKFLGLSFFVKSKGLVLGVKGEHAYMQLPEGEMLRLLQTAKQLPDPLPIAKLSFGQKLKGHFGWIVLVAFSVFFYFRYRKIEKEEGYDI
jgi:hypothetical protein